jgi:hypothetical protein
MPGRINDDRILYHTVDTYQQVFMHVGEYMGIHQNFSGAHEHGELHYESSRAEMKSNDPVAANPGFRPASTDLTLFGSNPLRSY